MHPRERPPCTTALLFEPYLHKRESKWLSFMYEMLALAGLMGSKGRLVFRPEMKRTPRLNRSLHRLGGGSLLRGGLLWADMVGEGTPNVWPKSTPRVSTTIGGRDNSHSCTFLGIPKQATVISFRSLTRACNFHMKAGCESVLLSTDLLQLESSKSFLALVC